MNALTVTLPAPNSHSNASREYQEQKALIAATSVIAVDEKYRPFELITVRWYKGKSPKSSTVYCNTWVRDPIWNSGHGMAGGYGYNKAAVSMCNALESAGVKLSYESHDERGVLETVAEAMGYKAEQLLFIQH